MKSNNSSNSLPRFSGMGLPRNVAVNGPDDFSGNEITRRAGRHGISTEPISMDTRVLPSSHMRSTASAPKALATHVIARSTTPSIWKLEDAIVLPEFHPLERSAVFVPNRDPSEVASRVSSVLRDRSIQAEYHGSKAICLTSDNVDFRVFLYRGQKQYGHGIIVEVQRRFGNSLSFHDDTQAILDAAEGKAVKPPTKILKTIPLVEEDQGENHVSSSSLDFVGTMLREPAEYAHILAFQTLASITDSEKIGKRTAVSISKSLLAPGNEVGGKVFDVVLKKENRRYEGDLRFMALTIVCNIIVSLNGNVSVDLQSVLWPVLEHELRKADETPQMAFIASRCLKPLLNQGMQDRDMQSALINALEVGKNKHAGLAEQSELCLELVGR